MSKNLNILKIRQKLIMCYNRLKSVTVMFEYNPSIVGDRILNAIGPTYYPIFIVITTFALCCYVYSRKSLTFNGCCATMFVGVSVFWYLSFSGFAVLLLFFFSSTFFSKLCKKKTKGTIVGIQEKSDCRDYMQVIANGGPAAAFAFLYRITGFKFWILLFGAAIAESNSDTWAGEIGMLGSAQPVSIITRKVVIKGLSGGVTRLGLFASLLGSFVIALLWSMLYSGMFNCWFLNTINITLSGFIGCLVDSILGDLFQVQYKTSSGKITEHEYTDGVRNIYFRGVKWMNNDIVNLLSNLSSSIVSFILILLLNRNTL